jgi:hypothetical protein
VQQGQEVLGKMSLSIKQSGGCGLRLLFIQISKIIPQIRLAVCDQGIYQNSIAMCRIIVQSSTELWEKIFRREKCENIMLDHFPMKQIKIDSELRSLST